MQVPTAKVKDGTGFKVVNKSEFNPDTDVLYKEPAKKKTTTKAKADAKPE